MASLKLNKIIKQHERTWSRLHKRLIDLNFDYNDLFEVNVYEYLSNQADSLSTSLGYLIPGILATTAFLACSGGSLVRHNDHDVPLNLYLLFVGPATTGKSQALKRSCIKPITIIEENDLESFLIEKCTSSALCKSVADLGKSFVASPEIYDLLNKHLKSDDENATGDAQLMRELFSGERTSYRYATEKTREIKENSPFSIVGATQVPFAATLICRMDQGHGLLDRFMIVFPPCLRPTVAATANAREALKQSSVQMFEDIFMELHRLCQGNAIYEFHENATELLTGLESEEILEINSAIADGVPPPKSKTVELIKRVATSIHIFNHVATKLLKGENPKPIPRRIQKQSVERAQKWVYYTNSQKKIATEFFESIVPPCEDEEQNQPSCRKTKTGILNISGPVVNARALKQSVRALRSLTEEEFISAAKELSDVFGKLLALRVPRQPKPSHLFVKKRPQDIDWAKLDALTTQENYTAKFGLPVHKAIGRNLQRALVDGQHVHKTFFPKKMYI